MRPALYVLGGGVSALGVAGLDVLLAWSATELLGPWGLFIEYLSMLALGGGYVGWSVYQMRLTAATRDSVLQGWAGYRKGASLFR